MSVSAASGNRVTAAFTGHRSHQCTLGLNGIEIHFRAEESIRICRRRPSLR